MRPVVSHLVPKDLANEIDAIASVRKGPGPDHAVPARALAIPLATRTRRVGRHYFVIRYYEC